MQRGGGGGVFSSDHKDVFAFIPYSCASCSLCCVFPKANHFPEVGSDLDRSTHVHVNTRTYTHTHAHTHTHTHTHAHAHTHSQVSVYRVPQLPHVSGEYHVTHIHISLLYNMNMNAILA